MKKKQIVLAVLVAMIGLSGYFNWSYQHSDNGAVYDSSDEELGEARLVSGKIKTSGDYFATSRTERNTGRSKAEESLREVANNPESSAEAKKEAEMKLVDMASRVEMEIASEAEIKAKGFSDAVVYINSDSVTVIVDSGGTLDAKATAKIQEIIRRITGIDGSKIGIAEYK